nr:hypothetical protein [Tanacetum cinerariifolium]
MIAGKRKPEGQWTADERKATNLDQRLKSLIMSDHGPEVVLQHLQIQRRKKNLINSIYETEKNKSIVPATPLSIAFFSTSIVQDFQDSPDDEEYTRSSHEYLNDLEKEYQARALLAKSKRFFKKGTQRILPSESQRNIIDSSVVVTDSLATDYDSSDKSSVCSIPLPPLKKLDSVEPISRPKTLKSNLRSKSTFKAESLKDVTINELSLALAKGNKSSSALKVHSTPVGKLKSVKIKDGPPLAIHLKSLGRMSSRPNIPRPSKHFFPPCIHCGGLSLYKERSIHEILNMLLKNVKLVVVQIIPQLITMKLNGSKEVKHFKTKRLKL